MPVGANIVRPPAYRRHKRPGSSRTPTPTAVGADSISARDVYGGAGFGRFEMRERQTKNFTNPKTKVTSKLEPTAIPGFKASGRLKEKVSG